MIKGLHLKAVFWLAVGTWVAAFLVSGQPIKMSLLQPSSVVLGVITVVTAYFERQAWSWKLWHSWFVSVPNLTGTYSGKISSTWVSTDASCAGKNIQVYLSVFQTLSGLTARLYTSESFSVSLCASLIESDDGHWEIIYTYRNEPNLLIQDRSRIHHGGIRLRIEADEPLQLRGNYFTDRSTSGEVVFNRISNLRSKSFEDAQKRIPKVEGQVKSK